MRTISKNVYKYGELTDGAKDKARDWYRQGALDFEWWDAVYEDAATMAAILGIDLMTRTAKLMNGTTIKKPNIYFSGFSSQGDGACFGGTYEYAKGASKKIRAAAPLDKELHRIADALQKVQRANFYRLFASVIPSGRYSHSRSNIIDVSSLDDERTITAETSDAVSELLRDFMDWIYTRLEKEWDFLNGDEQVAEAIEANEYEFDENGSRV